MGTLTSWREAHGEVKLQATDVTVQDLAVEVTPLVGRLTAGTVDFDPLEVRARGGVFVVDGSADLVQPHDRRHRQGHAGPAHGVALPRRGRAHRRRGGRRRDPRPARPPRGRPGTVRVKDGTLRLGVIRQPLTAINGVLTIDQGLVTLDGVSGMLGGGTVKVEGTARVAGLGLDQVKVAISGQGLGIRYPVARSGRADEIFDELKARVNADLTLTGRTGDLLLAGEVRAERSLYDSDIFLEEGLLAPDVPPETAARGIAPPAVDRPRHQRHHREPVPRPQQPGRAGGGGHAAPARQHGRARAVRPLRRAPGREGEAAGARVRDPERTALLQRDPRSRRSPSAPPPSSPSPRATTR